MKNLKLNCLIFFLFISLNVFSQDGKFTFTLPTSLNTSAGVFKLDGTLVRTLWNSERYPAGTYTKNWDGKDDKGVLISSPDASYQIKILTNNVNYTWQGTIGNTSANMTGPTKHRGYYFCMRGLAFNDTYGYFCTGYSEASPSMGKFLISKPQEKINFFASNITTADNNYVATDGINVYWGAFDANSYNNSFVYATKVSDDLETTFSNGSSYVVTYGKTYSSVISKLNINNSTISGLAVQKKGNYLFVARSGLNQLQVLNKNTGAVVQNLSYTTPKSLCIDGADNLWMVSGKNTVARYAINGDGSLTSSTLTLSGLLDPLAVQVSTDGTLISVADGSISQQVKFFNNSTGAFINLLGASGGYFTDPNVNDNKFYFNDAKGNQLPFIAYQPDGSFWVNDPGNYRVQHYNSGKTFLNRIMSLGATYSTSPDKNNINRVFANYLEFAVDYSVQTLTGSTGWSLVKNWGANVTSSYDEFTKLKYQTTLSNGRTYAFIRLGYSYELVELPSTGSMRFTGIMLSGTKLLCSDGSLQDYLELGSIYTYKRYPLTGFDGTGNPVWSSTAEILATATKDNVIGNPVYPPTNQIFSTTNKIVLFNSNIYANSNETAYITGYHLGMMQKGSNNTFLFETEKSTHRNYTGEYPGPGYFDVGNGVNSFAGGNVNIIDRNIITSYHGEFWKNSQTNKYNHYYDNGLAIGQFGITRPEAGLFNHAAPMMAGNALNPIVVKDANGDLYLWHGDESDHSGVHRWKITGLNTIEEKLVTIPYPSAYVVSISNAEDLMAGLPFNASLQNNTAGWTRFPTNDYSGNPLFTVVTSTQQYDNFSPIDLKIEYNSKTANTSYVSRELGNNNVSRSWKVTGFISYLYNVSNVDAIYQYFEILDNTGKVLTTFYPEQDKSSWPTIISRIKANTSTIFSTVENSENSVYHSHKLQPFTISIVDGVVTFQYSDYPPVITTISDPTGDWHKPGTLRARFVNIGNNYPAYDANIDFSNLKFYKDYSDTPTPPPTNQAPTASAGADISITLPTTSASLIGSGSDADGTISSYLWAKVSGPNTGVIVSPNTPNTQINSLTFGTYQFELTVTDNKGATGKSIVQVQVLDPVQAPVTATNNNNNNNTDAGIDLLPAVYPGNTVNGMDYKYYEGKWGAIPDFSSLSPVKTGTSTGFDLTLANRPTQYGFSFTGFINIPSDGPYKFYTTSDDGSNLYIDGVLTVANDGLHGSIEKSGSIGLKAGLHSITGLYFQQGGGQVFNVSYEGMGISKQLVPASALYRVTLDVVDNLLPAVNPGPTVSGLDYKYYEGKWNAVPDFNSLDPVKTGTSSNFDLSPADRPTQYGFSFTGFINVPSDGQYKFYTTSDDGSNLYIDGVLTVANDGLHNSVEKSGTIGLKAGLHAISALYFQQGGGQVLNVSYEGVGVSKQTIPASSLYRVTVDAFTSGNLLPAVNPANTVNGLDYKYYEGNWNSLPSFTSLNPIKTGNTANFNLSLANRSEQYGFSFTGFINVPVDGQYTFYTTSDDGSGLLIDNVPTVFNDALQEAIETSGTIGLKAGKHAITGLYFQQSGDQTFRVSYEGMGISKQDIPASALYRINSAPMARAGTDQSITLPSAVNNLPASKFAFSNAVKVFPNPAKDIANLSITSTGKNNKLTLSVYNSIGMMVKYKKLSTTLSNTTYQLDMAGLADGIYNIIVGFDDGQKITYKLLKKR